MSSCLWPSTSSTASARKPHDISTSSTPCERSQSSMKVRKGRPASGITGLGTVCVSGRRRVPSPPASTKACMPASAPDALVGEAGGGQRVAVEEVAAVHQQGLLHQLLHVVLPVELRELGPLGDEHGAVGSVERLPRRATDANARAEHVGSSISRYGIVRPHVRALALEPPGEHEAGGLADVVGVGLEGHPEQRDLLAHQRPEVLLQLADGAPLLQLVDLDDGGEELEVVTRVSCKLLER